jgi:hypothetical protein
MHMLGYQENEGSIHTTYMREIETIFANRHLPHPAKDILCERVIAQNSVVEF